MEIVASRDRDFETRVPNPMGDASIRGFKHGEGQAHLGDIDNAATQFFFNK
jgi:hypothetical protein